MSLLFQGLDSAFRFFPAAVLLLTSCLDCITEEEFMSKDTVALLSANGEEKRAAAVVCKKHEECIAAMKIVLTVY